MGGYVGVGDVIGEPRMAKDFVVERDGVSVPITDVAGAPNMDRQGTIDPDISEWVVPVRWIDARTREHAIRTPTSSRTKTAPSG